MSGWSAPETCCFCRRQISSPHLRVSEGSETFDFVSTFSTGACDLPGRKLPNTICIWASSRGFCNLRALQKDFGGVKGIVEIRNSNAYKWCFLQDQNHQVTWCLSELYKKKKKKKFGIYFKSSKVRCNAKFYFYLQVLLLFLNNSLHTIKYAGCFLSGL